MFERIDTTNATPLSISPFRHAAWPEARISGRLGSEMAAMLAMTVRPVISAATTEDQLARSLRDIGFYVAYSRDGLCLFDINSHVQVCTIRSIGFSAQDLEQRLFSH